MKKYVFALWAALLCIITFAHAQTATLASRVLVVKNTNSPISVAVANDYMARRRVTNFLNVFCPDGAVEQARETIDYPDYVTAIETPLLEYLKTHTNIDFIVFTKGVPIRIRNTPGKPYGGVCSLDSRVATLGYDESAASSVINVSDPSYGPTYVGTAWANKFFNSQTRFSHAAFGGYLVTRLDGYTQADAIAVTTRSLAADNNRQNGVYNKNQILLDACSDFGFQNRAAQPYTLLPAGYTPGQAINIIRESPYGEYNSDMGVAYKYLSSKNIPVLYDTVASFVGGKKNLAGYISWGSNDTHYDAAGYNSLSFSPGALAETAVSTSARTFLPTSGGQSLIDDLVAQGVTGVKGYTDEPLLQGIASPSILFNRYTSGWTLAESYYAASRLEGWMGILIGDPICRAYGPPDAVTVTPPVATVPDTTTTANSNVIVYPNPSSDVVNVNVEGDCTYKIYNSTGKLVKKDKLINKQINVHDLKSGIYLISISNGTQVFNRKISRGN